MADLCLGCDKVFTGAARVFCPACADWVPTPAARSEADARALIRQRDRIQADHDAMLATLGTAQARCTELLLENRALRALPSRDADARRDARGEMLALCVAWVRHEEGNGTADAMRAELAPRCPGGGYCEGTGQWCGYHGAGYVCDCASDCGECTHGKAVAS